MAEARKRLVEEREFLVKARLMEDIAKADVRLTDMIKEYRSEVRLRLSASTDRNYRLSLEALEKCWGNISVGQISARHLQDITRYIAARVNPTTTNIRLRAIRAFLNWLVNTYRLERLPGKVVFVKVDDELPRFFRPEELEKIIAHVEDPKIKAAIIVLAGTGLRRSELGMGTLEGEFLHLRHTKSGRDRIVPIPRELIPDFIRATEGRYIPDNITRAFLVALRAAGGEHRKRSLHSLRPTVALREYWRTRDIYHVKRMLGHSTVTVTERYLKFPDEYLIQVFGKRPSAPTTRDTFFPDSPVESFSPV